MHTTDTTIRARHATPARFKVKLLQKTQSHLATWAALEGGKEYVRKRSVVA